MPDNAPTNVRSVRKSRRAVQVAALAAHDLSQAEIARALGVSPKTIQRDYADVGPEVLTAKTILQRMADRFEERLPAEARADRYVECVEKGLETGNVSGAIQALARIDAIQGVITDAERLRSRIEAPDSQPAPMFAFSGPVTLHLGGQAGESEPESAIIDVTPTDSTE